MASIDKHQNLDGTFKYRLQIRKKGHPEISKNFTTEEDAKLYAAWKEDIIDQINSFDPQIEELMTLGAAIDLKEKNLRERGISVKDSVPDTIRLRKQFDVFLEVSLKNISYKDYIEHANLMIKTPVRHGGDPKNINTGVARLPAKKTILSRYNILQGVYSYMIELGLKVENHPNKIIKYLKTL